MYKKLFKRLLDIIISILCLILLFPLFFVIGLVIRKDIFYKQVRTGKGGKNFVIYKFRTMDGLKVTKIGKFLRKTGLDELPQFFNILKGDMSFVGPRPWITDYYDNFNSKQKRRCDVRPGLIGLAQLKGNSIDIFEKIRLDLEYIDNISFIGDIIIVFKTIWVLISRNYVDITNSEIMDEINLLSSQEEM